MEDCRDGHTVLSGVTGQDGTAHRGDLAAADPTIALLPSDVDRRHDCARSLATHSAFVRDHCAIPEDRAVPFGISSGYPDPEHPANNYAPTVARSTSRQLGLRLTEG